MAMDDQVRSLDHGVARERFARGWHCLGVADEFRDGRPHRVEAFGGHLVVWSGAPDGGGGPLHALDGVCRHQGHDLSRGQVVDGALRCAADGWRWNGDGTLAAIPYARQLPAQARTRHYEAVERNGLLMVWHDPEGGAARHELLPPELDDILDTGVYSAWTWNRIDVPSAHCREIVDNVVDMAHFFYIHFAFPTHFRNVFEDQYATQYMESRGRPDKAGEGYGDESLILKSEATYFGPAFMINWLKTDYRGFLTDVVLINCNVPTSSSSFTLQYGLKVRKPPGLDDATVEYIAGRYRDMFGSGFLQDVAIWLNKAPVENPLLCEEDGAVYQLRRWYEQFYVDVADVTPEMTARFEFEVDTTRANEYWREEVARNLADAAAAEPAT
jgi:3-ketosteroid 9alpha-monooxygenase subunit A